MCPSAAANCTPTGYRCRNPSSENSGRSCTSSWTSCRHSPTGPEWELKRAYAAINKFSVVTRTYPQAFALLGDVDRAWDWYATNNRYATSTEPGN